MTLVVCSDEYKFSFHFLGPSSIENETILCLTELQLSQQLFPEFALERNYTPQMNAYKQVQIKVSLKILTHYYIIMISFEVFYSVVFLLDRF